MSDHYSLLGVERDADAQTIKKRFRVLALKLHPDKNAKDPGATSRFQKLIAAYEVLQDPDQRRRYDLLFPTHKSNSKPAQPDTAKPNHGCHDQKDPTLFSLQIKLDASRREIERLQKSRSELWTERSALSSQIAALNFQLQALLRKQTEADDKAKQRSTLWGWMFVPKLTDEEKAVEDFARINRQATERIHQAKVQDLKARQATKDVLYDNLGRCLEEQLHRSNELCLAIHEHQRKTAAAKAARARAENLAREQQRQQERRRQEAEEQRQKEKKEAARQQERRRQEAEEQRQKEKEEAARQQRANQAPPPSNRKSRPSPRYSHRQDQHSRNQSREQASQQRKCAHQSFWEREDGPRQCEECLVKQWKFAFRCPGCRMVACASCRRTLRGR